MRVLIKRIFLLNFVFLILACGETEAQFTTTAARRSTISHNAPDHKSPAKSSINFFSLAGKSPVEIEKIYGKPSSVETKHIQGKDAEYRVYDDESGNRLLQIDFYKEKAAAFYFVLPPSLKTKSPEKTAKLCGLNLKLTNARTEPDGYLWKNLSGFTQFNFIEIRKFRDGGFYRYCEAHSKID